VFSHSSLLFYDIFADGVQKGPRLKSPDMISSISRLALKWLDRTELEIEDRENFAHQLDFLKRRE
jgi:hypothetical protein